MRIVRVASTAVAIAVVATPFSTVPVRAAPKPVVEITRIQYDSPGSDRGGRASLNAEYIRFANTGRKTVDLEGWYLRNNSFRYTFGRVSLKPGKKLTLRSGNGRDSASTLYWDRQGYAWNNTADLAILRNEAGELIDLCSYNSSKDPRAASTTCE